LSITSTFLKCLPLSSAFFHNTMCPRQQWRWCHSDFQHHWHTQLLGCTQIVCFTATPILQGFLYWVQRIFESFSKSCFGELEFPLLCLQSSLLFFTSRSTEF
jgi:hypothetical protein